jgi:hypothetical protein
MQTPNGKVLSIPLLLIKGGVTIIGFAILNVLQICENEWLTEQFYKSVISSNLNYSFLMGHSPMYIRYLSV